MNRRQFLAAAAAAPALRAQAPQWGSPVLDTHLHLRKGLDANFVHIEGCGVKKAVLLSRSGTTEQVHEIQAKYPNRFVWAVATDITKPEAVAMLTQAVKDGALGFGELKFHVAADGPELRRMYALAGRARRAHPGPLPGGRSLSWGRQVGYGLPEEFRGHAEGLPEDPLRRARRRLLG